MKRWAWAGVVVLSAVTGSATAQPQVVPGTVALDPLLDECNSPRTDEMKIGGVEMTVVEPCNGRVPGDLNLTFHFGFPPTEEQVAYAEEQLRNTSEALCDMTDGRLRVRDIRMTVGSAFERDGDIWWMPQWARSFSSLGLNSGAPGSRIVVFGANSTTGPTDMTTGTLVHEMGHLALVVGDSYAEQVRFRDGCGVGASFDGARGFSTPFFDGSLLANDSRDLPPFNAAGVVFVRGEMNPFFNTPMQGGGMGCVDATGADPSSLAPAALTGTAQGCSSDMQCAGANPYAIPFDSTRFSTILPDAVGAATVCATHTDCHAPGGMGRDAGFSCIAGVCRATLTLDDASGVPLACTVHEDCIAPGDSTIFPGFGCYFGVCQEVINPALWTFTRCALQRTEMAVAQAYDQTAGDAVESALRDPAHVGRDPAQPACPRREEFQITDGAGITMLDAVGDPVRAELAVRGRLPALDGNNYCWLDLNADGDPLDPGEECIDGGPALPNQCPGGGVASCDPTTCLLDWNTCPAAASCGNGTVESELGEQCEAGAAPIACGELGLLPAAAGASMICGVNCLWDRSPCKERGNARCPATAECVPGSLDPVGSECAFPPPSPAVPAIQRPCLANSCLFDDSVCAMPPTCGDGVLDADEQCDPAAALASQTTCQALGLVGGPVTCDANCTWNRKGCRSVTLMDPLPADVNGNGVGYHYLSAPEVLVQPETSAICDVDSSHPCCRNCDDPVPYWNAPGGLDQLERCPADPITNGCDARGKFLRVIAMPREHDTWAFSVLAEAREFDASAIPTVDAISLLTVDARFAGGMLAVVTDRSNCPPLTGPQFALGTTTAFECFNEDIFGTSVVTGPFLDRSRGKAFSFRLVDVQTNPLPLRPLATGPEFMLQANARRGTVTPTDPMDPNAGITFDTPDNVNCHDEDWCRISWNQETQRFESTSETYLQLSNHLYPLRDGEGKLILCGPPQLPECAVGVCTHYNPGVAVCYGNTETFLNPALDTSLKSEWGSFASRARGHYDLTVQPQENTTEVTTGAGAGFTPVEHCPPAAEVNIDTEIPTLGDTQVVILLQANAAMAIQDAAGFGGASRLDLAKQGVLAWLQTVEKLPLEDRPAISMRSFNETVFPPDGSPLETWIVRRLEDPDASSDSVTEGYFLGGPDTLAEFERTFLVGQSDALGRPEKPAPSSTHAFADSAFESAMNAFLAPEHVRRPNRRILLVTDGGLSSRATIDLGFWGLTHEVIQNTWGPSTVDFPLPPVDVIFVGYAHALEPLQTLAAQTGGMFMHAERDEEVIPAVFQTFNTLRGEDPAADLKTPASRDIVQTEAGPLVREYRDVLVEAGASRLSVLMSIPEGGLPRPQPGPELPEPAWNRGYTLLDPSGAEVTPTQVEETEYFARLDVAAPDPGLWRVRFAGSPASSVYIDNTKPKCYASTQHHTYPATEPFVDVTANAAWGELLTDGGVEITGTLHRPDQTSVPLAFAWDDAARAFRARVKDDMKRGHGVYRVVTECKIANNAIKQTVRYAEPASGPDQPTNPDTEVFAFVRQTSATFYWLGAAQPPLPTDPTVPSFGDADQDGIADEDESLEDIDNDGLVGAWDSDADGDSIPDRVDPDATTADTSSAGVGGGLIAGGSLRLEDGARVVFPEGTPAPATNVGSVETFYGVEARSATLISSAPVVLSEGAVIDGILIKSSSLAQDEEAVISGSIVTRTPLTGIDLDTFAVDIPFVSGTEIIPSNQFVTLAPGGYGNVQLSAGSVLGLGSGVYYLQHLDMNPSSTLSFDLADGPAYVYVRQSLALRGAMEFSSGDSRDLLIGYMGTGTAHVELPFAGALVAPYGELDFAPLGDPDEEFVGAFFAKDIRVGVGNTVVLEGFRHAMTPDGSGPPEGSCDDGVLNEGESDVDCGGPCGDSCQDGEQCNSAADCESSPCISGVCGQDPDGDGVPSQNDNCPADPNVNQEDLDDDGLGDVCDDDVDGDSVDNLMDNCPVHANANQADFDLDAIGDACDDNSLVANAGPDQLKECTGNGKAAATLNGSGSGAPSGSLSYLWTAPLTLSGATSAIASGNFPVGTTTVSLKVSQGVSHKTDTALVTVIDTTAPQLTIPSDVIAPSCGSVTLGQATATDVCGGTVTITKNAPASFKAGVTTVTWTAIDQYGNVATKTQKVTVGLGDSASCCPSGTNVIEGTSNNDVLNGTSGKDCILGKGAQDTIKGLGGNDLLSGGDGDDSIEGGDGDDIISGGTGQDIIKGQNGLDFLFGGDGDDQCWGGNQNDTLFGGQGQDKLYGEMNDDSLFGEDGDDRLEGSSGNDLLNGGGLHDICLPGTGTNTVLACEQIQ